MTKQEQVEQAIARDLELCDLGMALTTGKRRKAFEKQRKACYAAIREMNEAEGLGDISDDALMAELLS